MFCNISFFLVSEEIKDCTGKTSRDVFSYWDCTNGQELLRFCPPGQIYVNAEGRCKEGNLNDKSKFSCGYVRSSWVREKQGRRNFFNKLF